MGPLLVAASLWYRPFPQFHFILSSGLSVVGPGDLSSATWNIKMLSPRLTQAANRVLEGASCHV